MNGETASDIIFGTLVAVFGAIGLIMAVAARDTEILVFGVSLAGFAVAFIRALIRRRAAAHGALLAEARVHV